MVGFFFIIPVLGIVVSAILVFFGFVFLLDGRLRTATLIVGTVLPILLYLFFVKIANVPLPLGVFS